MPAIGFICGYRKEIMMKKYVETVSRGLTLRGFLELPDVNAVNGKKPPVIILFHGFTGCKSEKHFLLSRLSHALAEAGVASLRFDFGGTAESDGDFKDVTPRTEIEDGLEIVHYAKNLEEIDTKRVGLLGFSLGGFVAANVAGTVPMDLERLILISPATSTHKKMEKMYMETGSCGRGSLVVGRKFFEDGNDIDVMAVSANYTGPVTIIQGTIDTAVPPDTAVHYKNNFPNARLHYIEGAVHAYDSPEHFAELKKLVVEAAVENI